MLIWTTTPWTLPANVAVTLGEDAQYVAVAAAGRTLIMAAELVEAVAETAGWSNYEVLSGRASGSELRDLRYRHPIYPSVKGVIITGEHVDLSTGTGAVHTAPGHGEEDYLVGVKFDLPMPMPVDARGVFDEGGGPFAGMRVWEANPKIEAALAEAGRLWHREAFEHSYPHSGAPILSGAGCCAITSPPKRPSWSILPPRTPPRSFMARSVRLTYPTSRSLPI